MLRACGSSLHRLSRVAPARLARLSTRLQPPLRLCSAAAPSPTGDGAEPDAAADGSAPAAEREREARLASNQLRVAADLLRALAPSVRTSSGLAGLVKEASGRREFNSSSRRLYRELLWTAVRHWAWAEPLLAAGGTACAGAVARLAAGTAEVARLRAGAGLSPLAADGPDGGAAAALQPLCPAGAAPLCSAAELAAPGWLAAAGGAAPGSLPPPSLALRRPPVFLRLASPLHAPPVRAELLALGVAAAPVRGLPCALRLDFGGAPFGEADVTATRAFASGLFEVQDAGSQALLVSLGLAPASPSRPAAWLDYCAGAGGKALQLCSLLGPDGRVVASDVRASALEELLRRARRARLPGRRLEARCPPPASGAFDGVLVDAPCSGSGTWRRSPHLRWQTGAGTVAACALRQADILAAAARLVRPGGALVYATCSLARAENDGVADAFDARFCGTPTGGGGGLRGAQQQQQQQQQQQRRGGAAPAPAASAAAAGGGGGGRGPLFARARLPGAAAIGLVEDRGRATVPPALMDSDGYFVATWTRVR